jgi:Organic solute transporter Ostalpha
VWSYCTAINNFSQAWALYVLALFYMAMHTELSPLNPLRKFVTIKLVVFFSFWQGLVITMLCSMGILKPHESFRTYQSPEKFSGGLQDFIICIEMFFAAIGFAWSFPPRDYMTGEHPGFWKSFYALFDMADVVDDVQGAAFSPLFVC